jgi:hypothetical protein
VGQRSRAVQCDAGRAGAEERGIVGLGLTFFSHRKENPVSAVLNKA